MFIHRAQPMYVRPIRHIAHPPPNDDPQELVSQCDVITINVPLHKNTEGLFNRELISKMKNGARLVNTARGGSVLPRAYATP